jgi:SpoVK/Ycf46/Vps4 family AAA+-type ATPase
MEKNDKSGNAAMSGAFQLEDIAQLVKPKASWEDLTLNQTELSQLRDICNQARQIDRISRGWRSDRRPLHGKGLKALFSGPPGSGKTLAAEAIASELGMPLYRIDLSTVVSKYIGETEKNLRKVFDAARLANAILLFDELDALFGNRTKVSDAHDHYANIEIGYLLQRVEEYEGIIILTTNLHQNIDEAFIRRIRFIVEFPSPGNECKNNLLWDMVWRWLMKGRRKS